MLRKPLIVGVKKRDTLSLSKRDAHVPRGSNPWFDWLYKRIRLSDSQNRSTIAALSSWEPSLTTITSKSRQSLRQHRFEAAANLILLIVERDYNRTFNRHSSISICGMDCIEGQKLNNSEVRQETKSEVIYELRSSQLGTLTGVNGKSCR